MERKTYVLTKFLTQDLTSPWQSPPHDSRLRFGTEVGAVLGIDTIAVRCLGVVVMCAPAVSAIGEATDGDGDENSSREQRSPNERTDRRHDAENTKMK